MTLRPIISGVLKLALILLSATLAAESSYVAPLAAAGSPHVDALTAADAPHPIRRRLWLRLLRPLNQLRRTSWRDTAANGFPRRRLPGNVDFLLLF
jgi:hypothetical protein